MQNGSIKQHGKWWMLKYYANVMQDGVKVRTSLYKKLAPIDRDHQAKPDGSAPEKVRALAALELAPLNVSLHHAYSGDSLKTFLETFLTKGEGGKGRRLNPITIKSYNAMFKLAKDFLPEIELRQVRTMHIDKVLRDVASADGPERRAQSAYCNLKNFLGSAFRYAVRFGLTDINPVRDAAVPKGNGSDTHAYSLVEFHELLKAVTNPTARALIVLGMFTGLRLEEVKGLRWEDYDGKVLHVRRAVVQGKLVETKTDASKAPVPAIGIVQKVLAGQRKRSTGDGYIFHGDTGKPLIIENVIHRYILSVTRKKKMSWHGFHAFRRGVATHLGVNLHLPRETVKRILRHRTTDVTEHHYIKTSVEENRKALELVEKDFLKLKPALKL